MPRFTRRVLPFLAAALIFSLSAPSLLAQDQTPAPTWSQEDSSAHRQGGPKEARRPHQLQRLRLDHLRLPRQDRRPQGLRLHAPSSRTTPTMPSRESRASSRSTTRSKSFRTLPTTTAFAPPSTTASTPKAHCANTTPTRALSDRLSGLAAEVLRRWPEASPTILPSASTPSTSS